MTYRRESPCPYSYVAVIKAQFAIFVAWSAICSIIATVIYNKSAEDIFSDKVYWPFYMLASGFGVLLVCLTLPYFCDRRDNIWWQNKKENSQKTNVDRIYVDMQNVSGDIEMASTQKVSI